MDNDSLKQALTEAFNEEAPDLLAQLEQSLITLEQTPEDIHEPSDQLKRALHSLKGAASAIGRHDIRNVCHAMESFINAYNNQSITPQAIDHLHEGLVFLNESCQLSGTADDAASEKICKHLENSKPGESNNTDTIAHQQDSASAVSGGINPPVETTVAAETPPINDQSDKTQPQTGKEAAEQKSPPVTTRVGLDDSHIKVGVNKIDDLQVCSGEMVSLSLRNEIVTEEARDIYETLLFINDEWRELKSQILDSREHLPNKTYSRLDRLGSSLFNQLRKTQKKAFTLAKTLQEKSNHFDLLNDELDQCLRSMRMVPLGPFLESYKIVARDAARQLNKKVQLTISTPGVEIDRLVINALKEPLMHIIRNAVAHGIEMPSERLEKGKPESGEIQITGNVQGDMVVIKIMDDGKGFDFERIAEKARKLGLLATGESLNEERILSIISHPGFSTGETINAVSGRGVGMDVVANAIEKTGGDIHLETMPDAGSCLTLLLPLSLSISQGLILQLGEQKFGIYMDSVERIVRKTIEDLSEVNGFKVLVLDEEPISVTSLSSILQTDHFLEKEKVYPFVIIRSGVKRVALMVDDVPGEVPLVMKTLGEPFEHLKLYAGGVLLSDGGVLPVLDSRELINSVVRLDSSVSVQKHDTPELDTVQDQAEREQKLILVVDDSITTRTLERNILETAGYTVAVATDGVEALELLLVEDEVALMVTDLEMPRMNGFELCKRVRSGRHHELPIIMVTSVGNESEKRKGLEAGADAYIVKNNFEQDRFLDLVDRFAYQ